MATVWKTRLRRMLLGGLVAWLLAVLFAHPFFAVVAPSGGKVLVAEGWMHEEGLKAAAELFEQGKYEHLYLTGTPRPFAYYLRAGDVIQVEFPEPQDGPLALWLAGLPKATWELRCDSAIRDSGTIDQGSEEALLQLQQVRVLRLAAGSSSPPSNGEPVLFIGRLQLAGTNRHLLNATIRLVHPDGSEEAGQPTFAHQAFATLQRLGVPASQMTVVPTWTVEKSRTLSTARDLVAYANAHDIRAFDVATLGVHARRTRNMYRKAKGTKEGIGIISLHDPWCQRWTWWTNYYGWFQMLKEFIAWPAPWLISDEEPTT